DAGYVLGEMEAAQNRMNILILDACRNNPFGRSYRSPNRGLTQMAAPTGSFIAYATGPGSVAADGDGSNGLYAPELARAMRTAGAKLEDVFKIVLSNVKKASGGSQVPWTASSVEWDFYFAQLTDAGKGANQPAFNLGDLDVEAKKEENLKKNWAITRQATQKAYNDVLTFEKRDVSTNLKADAWKRFITTYAQDDPYSTDDNLMRDRAQTQVTYWERNRKAEVQPSAKSGSSDHVEFTTTMGNFTVLVYEKEAPVSARNFLAYVDSGFYSGLTFHRVIPGFMVQGGGYMINLTKRQTILPPIKNESDNGMKNERGTLSMARTSDPHSATSQFFISVVDNASLDISARGWGYAVFGKVIAGMDIVDKIVAVKTETRGTMENVPVDPVIIISVKRK
ncbi:MAG: peptidylprolyl isomerase, partial [Ignavibacteria bacterium]|nr:peptidylprolyl isomerase [Ignavibacteria bacterium]